MIKKLKKNFLTYKNKLKSLILGYYNLSIFRSHNLTQPNLNILWFLLELNFFFKFNKYPTYGILCNYLKNYCFIRFKKKILFSKNIFAKISKRKFKKLFSHFNSRKRSPMLIKLKKKRLLLIKNLPSKFKFLKNLLKKKTLTKKMFLRSLKMSFKKFKARKIKLMKIKKHRIQPALPLGICIAKAYGPGGKTKMGMNKLLLGFFDFKKKLNLKNLKLSLFFKKLNDKINPPFHIKKLNLGKKTFPIPLPLYNWKKKFIIARWIKKALKNRTEHFETKFSKEIFDLLKNRGNILKLKAENYKIAREFRGNITRKFRKKKKHR